MTGVRFRFNHVRVPFRQPYVTAAGVADVREVLIVRLENAGGVIGVGEGSLLPHEPEGFEQVVRVAELAARLFLSGGVEALDAAQLAGARLAGLAAVETAVYDALARADGVPLARKLEPAPADRVEVNALVTAADTAAAVEQTIKAVEAGFRTVKLKVGTLPTPEAEAQRIAAVNGAPAVRFPPLLQHLRLDANGAWDETTANALFSSWLHHVEYVEQPLPPGNLAAMRRLREGTGVRIAADEDITDLESARRVIKEEAADVLVLKPICLGGVRRTMNVVKQAKAAGLDVTITTSIDTGIGTALALQLAAAIRSPHAAGLATAELLKADLLRRPLGVEDGAMPLPVTPGLGIEIDSKAIQRHTVREWVIDR